MIRSWSSRRRPSAGKIQEALELDEPRARHVLDRDAAVPYRLEETWHPDARGRIQFERIAPICVNMTPDDIALFGPAIVRTKMRPSRMTRSFAFHEQKAEITRQVGLFEIGENSEDQGSGC